MGAVGKPSPPAPIPGFVVQREKHRPPAPSQCCAILWQGRLKISDFSSFNTSGKSDAEIPRPGWKAAFEKLERLPRKAETADNETHTEATWFHL